MRWKASNTHTSKLYDCKTFLSQSGFIWPWRLITTQYLRRFRCKRNHLWITLLTRVVKCVLNAVLMSDKRPAKLHDSAVLFQSISHFQDLNNLPLNSMLLEFIGPRFVIIRESISLKWRERKAVRIRPCVASISLLSTSSSSDIWTLQLKCDGAKGCPCRARFEARLKPNMLRTAPMFIREHLVATYSCQVNGETFFYSRPDVMA